MTDITVTITVTHKISQRDIADQMVTALEINDMVNAWCSSCKLKGHWRTVQKAGDLSSKPWYDAPEIYDDKLELEVDEIINETTGEVKTHKITFEDFKKGLQLMANDHPDHFGDMMDENGDAVTADVFLQCIVLKEVVYG